MVRKFQPLLESECLHKSHINSINILIFSAYSLLHAGLLLNLVFDPEDKDKTEISVEF
jgi:hypothetical protein